tara:strand:+ start:183 stop:650 length:468 start_codon:yes stop_codon:yes gene_type:complete
MAYATLDNLRARQPHRTIDTNSKPTQSEVQTWLDEGEAILNAELKAGELLAPYTDAEAIKVLRVVVLNYAEGRLRQAYATSGGDHTNTDGLDQLDQFYKTIEDIRINPMRWGAVLGAGSAPDSARRIRSYTTDNTAGKSISGGDFDPVFTMSETF